ncbi:alpha/beta hydrolase [Streptomyces sp. NTH33]|uniref:alpha/beta hydrolase n=1 Tax=Streptomyces sp. NTH33 TaxID=1735453 RepID=UPI0021ABA521|nr:alpha/beta hydrolase [Streptomyces sp. NTH33]
MTHRLPVVALSAVTALPLVPAVPAVAPPASAQRTSTGAGTTTALPARLTGQKLNWKRCDPDKPGTFRCATLQVPLDYRDAGGDRIGIAVSRIAATAPDRRHGVLLSNPGGPGESGLSRPLTMSATLPERATEQYDLIGFDPRGVGRSAPLSCGLTPDADQEWMRPYHERTFDQDVAWARDFADTCRKNGGSNLPHITTRNTARDLDLLRTVLGEQKISYLGYSYGTYLGAVYAQMFPRRTDRFVLDSAVDPNHVWRGMVQSWAEEADRAFDRWAVWTAARHETYGLGTTAEKVAQAFWDLVEQARQEPVELDGTRYGPDEIRGALHVDEPELAARTVVELRKAASGKAASGTAVATPSDASARTDVPFDNSAASFAAVVCNDNSAAWPREPEQYRKDVAESLRRYPLTGDIVSNVKPCAFWDRSLEPATKVNNRLSALIVQNEFDSFTPLPQGQAMHKALHGSRMLTAAGGTGHAVYPSGNRCVDDTVAGYLATGTLPEQDTTCAVSKDTDEDQQRASPT